jgi:uncharacterized membrane protein YfcA
VDWQRDLVGLVAGFVLAAVTTPVGVSGAVFLLPFQLSVLHVPSPRITPTNLLYNVISGPGGLARYLRRGQLDRALTRQLVSGSVPGVVLGAVIRVYVVADPDVFRLLAAAVLAPTGLLILRRPAPGSLHRHLQPRTVRVLAFTVGVVGGIYGIGGGSVIGPVLVGTGLTVASVAPAALFSTWVPPTHHLSVWQRNWASELEKATAGRIKVQELPKAPAAPPGTFDAVRDGLVDFSYVTASYTPARHILPSDSLSSLRV